MSFQNASLILPHWWSTEGYIYFCHATWKIAKVFITPKTSWPLSKMNRIYLFFKIDNKSLTPDHQLCFRKTRFKEQKMLSSQPFLWTLSWLLMKLEALYILYGVEQEIKYLKLKEVKVGVFQGCVLGSSTLCALFTSDAWKSWLESCGHHIPSNLHKVQKMSMELGLGACVIMILKFTIRW